MFFLPGRQVVVSLSDGSSVTGTTAWAWWGRLRLREVSSAGGTFPGELIVYRHAVLAVQVVMVRGRALDR
ncbi:hypothetical protein [Rathayibacter sp. VKM Ac-2630]|uniref:hypothetical protein n=1 Tax=Rathayibacter sp. VKM Ac-2630 TaxID=1938617 RepID=UPI000981B318|nr:hypothetical protein [Rathayibacter sp. VKM Ac-2630]OOB90738.1 hypothetical protein B0T42_10040 [Rathayibacter sp. VKM Ac-2630]